MSRENSRLHMCAFVKKIDERRRKTVFMFTFLRWKRNFREGFSLGAENKEYIINDGERIADKIIIFGSGYCSTGRIGFT